ncbi:MAG: LLM class flavin-dependent oxidoreductase [Proteobacteria bacterium]|nr:LLM class flavin-dependent oxidoreductase [Pseudomonadota bacterium]
MLSCSPVGIHTAWWRCLGAYPDANFNLRDLVRFIQTLERGCFDAFFMADHSAVLNMPMAALRRSATATSFEPLTLLSALAMATQRIGLIATASTTFEEPYHVARRFASLDHASEGRAGWNVVTMGVAVGCRATPAVASAARSAGRRWNCGSTGTEGAGQASLNA